MARAWIVDLWVKESQITLPDGTTQKIRPTAAQTKSIKTLPEQFRTVKYGRGKRWRVAWHEDTKQRAKLFDTKKDAEAFATELDDDIRMGRYIDPSHRERRFSDLAEVWLQSKGKIKDSTYRRYRRDLDNYVLPRWANIKVGSIKREHIDAWVQQLRQGVAPRAISDSMHTSKHKLVTRQLSAASIDGIVRIAFGAPLRYAVSQSWIGRNPLVGIELPRDEDADVDLPTLSYTQVEHLATRAAELTNRQVDSALVHLLAYSGPRIGEATALKVKDFDAVKNRLRVSKTWTVDRDGRRKLGTPKTWERRWVPLPKFLTTELMKLSEGRDLDNFLFRTKGGHPIDSTNWYNRVWLKIRTGTLAQSFSVHDLRHVAATLAIAANADVKLVQQMLGHKDATETLNTYSALWPDKVGEVIDLVEKRRNQAIKDAAGVP